MKKEYERPQIEKVVINIEESFATASIVTGGTGSSPNITNEEEQQSTTEKWEFNF